eukprot:456510_1
MTSNRPLSRVIMVLPLFVLSFAFLLFSLFHPEKAALASVITDANHRQFAAKYTLIVMSDNRDILLSNFLSFTTAINYLYATQYGYRFVFYQWNNTHDDSDHKMKFAARNGCYHSLYGPKSAPWCKVITIYHALNTFDHIDKVIFLDSDAIFFNHKMNIDYYLKTAQYILRNSFASAIVPCNCPWHSDFVDNKGVNTGIIIFRKGNMSNCILTDWWNADYPVCKKAFTKEFFEQTCFSRFIKKKYRKHISILNETALVEYEGQYWRHIGSHAMHDRLARFRNIFNNLSTSMYKRMGANISQIIDQIKRHHIMYINDNDVIKTEMETYKCSK